MTSYEFAESLAFERLEPDPAEKSAQLLAVLLTWFANVHRDTANRPRPFSVEDFMPNPYAPSRAEREERFAAIMADFERGRKERQH